MEGCPDSAEVIAGVWQKLFYQYQHYLGCSMFARAAQPQAVLLTEKKVLPPHAHSPICGKRAGGRESWSLFCRSLPRLGLKMAERNSRCRAFLEADFLPLHTSLDHLLHQPPKALSIPGEVADILLQEACSTKCYLLSTCALLALVWMYGGFRWHACSPKEPSVQLGVSTVDL